MGPPTGPVRHSSRPPNRGRMNEPSKGEMLGSSERLVASLGLDSTVSAVAATSFASCPSPSTFSKFKSIALRCRRNNGGAESVLPSKQRGLLLSMDVVVGMTGSQSFHKIPLSPGSPTSPSSSFSTSAHSRIPFTPKSLVSTIQLRRGKKGSELGKEGITRKKASGKGAVHAKPQSERDTAKVGGGVSSANHAPALPEDVGTPGSITCSSDPNPASSSNLKSSSSTSSSPGDSSSLPFPSSSAHSRSESSSPPAFSPSMRTSSLNRTLSSSSSSALQSLPPPSFSVPFPPSSSCSSIPRASNTTETLSTKDASGSSLIPPPPPPPPAPSISPVSRSTPPPPLPSSSTPPSLPPPPSATPPTSTAEDSRGGNSLPPPSLQATCGSEKAFSKAIDHGLSNTKHPNPSILSSHPQPAPELVVSSELHALPTPPSLPIPPPSSPPPTSSCPCPATTSLHSPSSSPSPPISTAWPLPCPLPVGTSSAAPGGTTTSSSSPTDTPALPPISIVIPPPRSSSALCAPPAPPASSSTTSSRSSSSVPSFSSTTTASSSASSSSSSEAGKGKLQLTIICTPADPQSVLQDPNNPVSLSDFRRAGYTPRRPSLLVSQSDSAPTAYLSLATPRRPFPSSDSPNTPSRKPDNSTPPSLEDFRRLATPRRPMPPKFGEWNSSGETPLLVRHYSGEFNAVRSIVHELLEEAEEEEEEKGERSIGGGGSVNVKVSEKHGAEECDGGKTREGDGGTGEEGEESREGGLDAEGSVSESQEPARKEGGGAMAAVEAWLAPKRASPVQERAKQEEEVVVVVLHGKPNGRSRPSVPRFGEWNEGEVADEGEEKEEMEKPNTYRVRVLRAAHGFGKMGRRLGKSFSLFHRGSASWKKTRQGSSKGISVGKISRTVTRDQAAAEILGQVRERSLKAEGEGGSRKRFGRLRNSKVPRGESKGAAGEEEVAVKEEEYAVHEDKEAEEDEAQAVEAGYDGAEGLLERGDEEEEGVGGFVGGGKGGFEDSENKEEGGGALGEESGRGKVVTSRAQMVQRNYSGRFSAARKARLAAVEGRGVEEEEEMEKGEEKGKEGGGNEEEAARAAGKLACAHSLPGKKVGAEGGWGGDGEEYQVPATPRPPAAGIAAALAATLGGAVAGGAGDEAEGGVLGRGAAGGAGDEAEGGVLGRGAAGGEAMARATTGAGSGGEAAAAFVAATTGGPTATGPEECTLAAEAAAAAAGESGGAGAPASDGPKPAPAGARRRRASLALPSSSAALRTAAAAVAVVKRLQRTKSLLVVQNPPAPLTIPATLSSSPPDPASSSLPLSSSAHPRVQSPRIRNGVRLRKMSSPARGWWAARHEKVHSSGRSSARGSARTSPNKGRSPKAPAPAVFEMDEGTEVEGEQELLESEMLDLGDAAVSLADSSIAVRSSFHSTPSSSSSPPPPASGPSGFGTSGEEEEEEEKRDEKPLRRRRRPKKGSSNSSGGSSSTRTPDEAREGGRLEEEETGSPNGGGRLEDEGTGSPIVEGERLEEAGAKRAGCGGGGIEEQSEGQMVNANKEEGGSKEGRDAAVMAPEIRHPGVDDDGGIDRTTDTGGRSKRSPRKKASSYASPRMPHRTQLPSATSPAVSSPRYGGGHRTSSKASSACRRSGRILASAASGSTIASSEEPSKGGDGGGGAALQRGGGSGTQRGSKEEPVEAETQEAVYTRSGSGKERQLQQLQRLQQQGTKALQRLYKQSGLGKGGGGSSSSLVSLPGRPADRAKGGPRKTLDFGMAAEQSLAAAIKKLHAVSAAAQQGSSSSIN